MAGYSLVKDTIFTGATGRELRRHPAEVRELQFWLCAGPDRDPFGVFIFEPETVAPRLGRSIVSIRKSLETLEEMGFLLWDVGSQFCWVREMAHHQFGTPLKAVDNRCATAKKWYANCPGNLFLGPWFDRYVVDFHLDKDPHAVERRNGGGGSQGAYQAPVSTFGSEDPLRSIQGSIDPPTEPDPARAREAPLKGRDLEEAFERLWTSYPNAVEKKESKALFVKLHPSAALVAEMLAAVELQRAGKQWREGFIPKLKTWIQGNRWQDRIENQPVLTKKSSNTLAAVEQFVQHHRAGHES